MLNGAEIIWMPPMIIYNEHRASPLYFLHNLSRGHYKMYLIFEVPKKYEYTYDLMW